MRALLSSIVVLCLFAGCASISSNPAPVAINRSPPVYPVDALAQLAEGFVDVEFTIDTNGQVRDIMVLDAEPPGVFDYAAINSIRQWHFEPVIDKGHPVEVHARQRVEFALGF